MATRPVAFKVRRRVRVAMPFAGCPMRTVSDLIEQFGPRLTPPVLQQIREFDAAGEPGLAFEELCAYLHEQSVELDAPSVELIREVGTEMGTDPAWWHPLSVKRT